MSRHPARWGSALCGLTFLTVAAAWAVLELDLADVDGAGVAVAVALIVLGVVGIAATVVIARRPTLPATPAGERLEEDDHPTRTDRPTDLEEGQR
ncbi:hypothetical protein GCM10009821_17500 [Aeromicrobium halocynthiae]|uniref:Uncharacterized protein n=1 Tax=Aeromicrobium halocynthiae TaxID=560557 RepID=A0ABN2VZE8_9ACTN